MLGMAQRFADQASNALEEAVRVSTERERRRLHAQLEASLLPSVALTTMSLRVVTHYQGGEQRMLLGGDFFDVIELDHREIAFLIGDVSGHGPAAAALGATLRAAWQGLVAARVEPAEILRAMDAVLRRERSNIEEFATVCLGTISPARDRCSLTCAGHPLPLMITHGEVEEVEMECPPPLGWLDPSTRWSPQLVDLPTEWTLVLYTDGLVEGRAEPHGRDRFGIDRLIAHMASLPTPGALDARELDGLVATARRANGGDLDDDVAILVLSTDGAENRAGAVGTDARERA